MTMITKSGQASLRGDVVKYLSQKRLERSDYKILDIGGIAMQWLGDFQPDYADIQAPAKYQGDINNLETWEHIERDGPWDFISCTHTLEDLRNPEVVIRMIRKNALAGFIAVPHKHSELTTWVHPDYVGYCHHRWIFCIQDDKFRAIAKWPVTGQLRKGGRPGPGFLPWLNPGMANQGELAFLWEGDFDFEIVNNDFPGLATEGCDGMLRMIRDEMGPGL